MKLRFQSLKTFRNEIINVEQAVREPAVPSAQESISANNELIVPMQVTCMTDNGKIPMDCAGNNTKYQWKEIRIKKENEFFYLKSLEI